MLKTSFAIGALGFASPLMAAGKEATSLDSQGQIPLPDGVRSRQLNISSGLNVHVLEAGYATAGNAEKPLILLLHGFPELAYSWRNQFVALAQAGYHVVAPDLRGCGRTTGSDDRYDGDWRASGLLNMVNDTLALVQALGHTHVHALVGHDFGSPVSAWCALTRPDIFRSVVLMSAPFGGPPNAATATQAFAHMNREAEALKQLDPPRLHYFWYYSRPQANNDMLHAPQGLHDFMRAYYHVKSADWAPNKPHNLKAWKAEELALLPHYYVMPLHKTMAQAVAEFMPDAATIAACAWLPEADMAVYTSEYTRRGFQGGLQWYRCFTDSEHYTDLTKYSGKAINVPSAFIAGAADWGVLQTPGAFEKMQGKGCTDMRMCELIPGAGHWVQQEQAEAVNRSLLRFLAQL
jgi:pimeloyl-ACP methyl ester carboxylesterase